MPFNLVGICLVVFVITIQRKKKNGNTSKVHEQNLYKTKKNQKENIALCGKSIAYIK